jgi:hypothetical protein
VHPFLANEAILGETAVEEVADEFLFRTDIIVPRVALETLAADVSRSLTSDSIAYMKTLNPFSQLGDCPGELVAHDDRRTEEEFDVIVIDVNV